MKIKDQVCTLPQAVRLSELGITQNSTFHHVYVNEDIDWQIWMEGSFDEYDDEKQMYCAFTVAELGQMLPNAYDTMRTTADISTGDIWRLYNPDGLELKGLEDEKYDTEAMARASALIYLLENDMVAVSEINKRLLK